MKQLENLKERICSFENLLEAYRNAEKGKRDREEVLNFSQNLEENLFALRDELLNQTYCVGEYREFYVNYPKRRLVMALEFRDRIVQWAVYQQINPFIDARFDEHSYGCRRGKGSLKAAQTLFRAVQAVSRKPDADEWRIIKIDVSKFFYRIDHETALLTYGAYIADDWTMWLLGAIINDEQTPFGLPVGASIDSCERSARLYDVGVPIGNLTSQETANTYLNVLDEYVRHALKVHFYARNMDDIAMIVHGEEAARDALKSVREFLKSRLLLDINRKTGIRRITEPVEFVGVVITPHGMRIRKQTTKHVKRALRHIERAYSRGEIELSDALSTIRSYFGLTRHKSGYNLRRWISENIVFRRESG